MLTEVRSVALVLLAFGMAVLAMMLSAKEASAQNDANLKQLIASAPKLETEDLCVPVKSVRRGMLLWAPNPDGKSWDLLQIYFPQYGGPNIIVIIDLGTGEVKTIQTERGWNFHLCPSVIAPNGKLFISILDRRLRQRICIYNPATIELKIDAVKMPDGLLGETHPLVLGTDGKLYAIGQHPSRTATAAQIDPDTLRVTFYGPIGPSHAPNPCWGYSGGADDRYIYIASGKIPWYLIAYDRRTGKWKVLAKTDTVGGYVSVSQHRDGCTGYVRKNQKATPIRGWLYRGEFIPIKSPNEKPPWSQRAMQLHLPPRPEINDALADPDENGFAEIWVRPREAKVHIG
ncbi:MAG TPA: hypothetical protein EYP10_11530, partial [Armatimonadetes bacterium]|nr:hypothetical protein [Armatimonadota bacterium]